MSVARRRQMIERGHASLSITAQCRLVSISRSSFYYAPVPETAETLALMAVIDAAFLDHPWYGSRQMARHLCRLGHAVGRRRVRRPMAKMGLAPIYQRPRTGPVANSGSGGRRGCPPLLSCFVRDGKSEAAGEQVVLLADGPSTREPEALAQP